MKNFAQYVFTLPTNAQDPIKLVLAKSWDQLSETQRTITQPQLRRELGIAHTPARITITNPENKAAILKLAETSTQHVAKFEEQAAVAKTLRAKSKAFDAFMKEAADLI